MPADPDFLRKIAAWITPPERMAVSEAARRFRILSNPGGGYSGPWLDAPAPYLERPMDCLSDPAVSLVAIMGPGQSGKSEIGNNWVLWSVVVDPGSIIWVAPDKDLMRSFVVQKVNPMIRHSAELRARQLKTGSADNIFSKEFEGVVVNYIWPVASQMRMRSAPRWVIDDYDGVPQDIDGEGDPITLMGTRTTTFEGRAKGLVMSSPALGVHTGIEALVATGTDERWHWPCPHCGEFFSPDTTRDLKFDHKLTPGKAGASATMACATNGCIIDYADKPAMMAKGRWIAHGQKILQDGTVEGRAAGGSVRSFRVDGLMGFSTWAKLADEWRRAEIKWEREQDETALRAFFNTRAGANYSSKIDDENATTADELAARAEDWPMGQVPPGVKFLIAAVDVQSNRFEVGVIGFGGDGESWLIDRFAIRQLADARTDVRPAKAAAHWELLHDRVVAARYPLLGDGGRVLPIAAVAIDSGGMPGVSNNAAAFVRHERTKRGVPDWQVMLVKGSNNLRAPPLGKPSFEVDDKGKRLRDANSLWVLGVHELKDILDARIRTPEPGPGYLHLSSDLDRRYFDELRGEQKRRGVWTRTGHNETLDIYVYCEAARLRLRVERVTDWSRPPVWAQPIRVSTIAAPPVREADEVPPAEIPPPRATRFRSVRSSGVAWSQQ